MGGGGGSAPSIGGAISSVTGSFPSIQRAYNRFAGSEPYLQQQGPILQQLGQFGTQAAGAISPYILSILQNPYSVPPELLNIATQGARAAFQARGNVFGNQAIAGELLNREQIRQQRLSSAMGLAGQTEQLLGYPSQQLTAAELGQTGAFASLINPAYGLAGQALGAETAASAQNKGGTSNALGAGVGILGAAATAY